MSSRHRLLAVVSCAIGAVLILIGTALAIVPRSSDFGSVVLSPAPTPSVVDAPPSGSSALPTAGSGPATASAETTAAVHVDAPPNPPTPSGIPVTLQLSSLGVTADVVEVVTQDGELEVPANPADVGWWTASALVGATRGTTVIDGHVDSAALGPGAFFELANLTAGDTVSVTTASGGTVKYLVDARHTYRKTDGLPPDLFDSSGPHRLALITCGGSFDHDALSYDDNIVVMASALPG